MKTLEGMYDGKGLKIAIVASRFNEFITTKLVGGAEDCLLRHGTDGDDITLAWVPGAFEIPLAAKKLAFSGKYDAVSEARTLLPTKIIVFARLARRVSRIVSICVYRTATKITS